MLGADRQPQPLVLEPRWPAEGVALVIEALPGGTRADRYRLAFKVDALERSDP